MTAATPDLNALLGSRICHDLISPLGAIGNGVELLQMSGMTDSPEIALISESVENANARIRFFRVAFGAATPDQRLSRAEIMAILAPVGKARRIEIDWQVDGDVPRDHARLAFLLLQCCESALAWGGRVTIRAMEGVWQIVATGGRMRIDPECWAELAAPSGRPVEAASVHFPLARDAATGMARTITQQVDETEIALSF